MRSAFMRHDRSRRYGQPASNALLNPRKSNSVRLPSPSKSAWQGTRTAITAASLAALRQAGAKYLALYDYVEQVTLRPATCTKADVDALRETGATDAEIHATVQVCAYFNYINRVADALGVDLEPEMERGDR